MPLLPPTDPLPVIPDDPSLPDLRLDGAPWNGRPPVWAGSLATPGDGSRAEEPLRVELVEQRPELLSAPVPSYPDGLRRLGVEGRVTVDVVVDTMGRVEPRSLTVVEAAHPAFVEPVRQALSRALFRPARVYGRPVRVLVRIPFEFRITR